jgi:hypothetical protein
MERIPREREQTVAIEKQAPVYNKHIQTINRWYDSDRKLNCTRFAIV